MDEITRLQAEVLKVLSSPVRIEILHLLGDGPLEVSKIAGVVGVSQPNASQHLSVLRGAGLVESDRRGREIRYQLVDPEVIVACEIMRGVLQRRIRRLAALARTQAATGVTHIGRAS
jgi:ArsR family transcriptional regulator